MRKNVETESTYCNSVTLPLSSIRPQVFILSAEIVWKSAVCERHKAEIYSVLNVYFSFDSSVLAFEQSAVNPQCVVQVVVKVMG